MWELARLCQRFGGLPLEGGVAEQPFGALVRMRALLSYADDYAVFQEQGTKAPQAVQQRVLRVLGVIARQRSEH